MAVGAPAWGHRGFDRNVFAHRRPWPCEPAPQPLQPAQVLHRGCDPTRLRGAVPGSLLPLDQTLQSGVGLERHEQKRRDEGTEDTDEILGRGSFE